MPTYWTGYRNRRTWQERKRAKMQARRTEARRNRRAKKQGPLSEASMT